MASLLPFLFSLLPLLTLSLPTQSTSHPSLIQSTCSTTTYYDLCVAALAADPGSSSADVRGLSAISVSVAAANATDTSAFVSLLAKNATADPALRAMLRACVGKYSNAREALQSAAEALAAELYDYAFVHVSAAAEYPSVCRVLFRQVPRLAYPPEMARREEGLERLCAIALDIISLLG